MMSEQLAKQWANLPLATLADRIYVHLKRMERDPKINTKKKDGTSPFFMVNTYCGGRYVRLIYVSYQGAHSLTRAKAAEYLAWLDAGNNGTHYQMERQSV